MRGAGGRYVNVVSRNQVIETDRCGKAWIVMGMIELAPDQTPTDRVRCSVLNLRTGRFFNPYAASSTTLESRMTRRAARRLASDSSNKFINTKVTHICGI